MEFAHDEIPVSILSFALLKRVFFLFNQLISRSAFRRRFVGWVHVPLACELFIKENWQEIVKRNIYMNFILHLNNLFDYQLLSSDTLRSLIKLFHEMTSEHN